MICTASQRGDCRWDCLNSVVDLLLIEFNDRFGETNSNLFTYMAAFIPKESFDEFKIGELDRN